MNEIITAHCRLCAKSKPYAKLLNLQTDEDRKRKVMVKLFRLSLEVVNFNSAHDVLPKTVCFPCMEALDNSFEFVLHVEASQNEFGAYGLVNVKQEILEDAVNNSHEEKFTESTVKVEIEIGDEVFSNDSLISSGNSDTLQQNCIKNERQLGGENVPDNTTLLVPKIHTLECSIKKEKETGKGEDRVLNTTLLIDSQVSWKDYSWLCAYCDVMFPSIDELKEHSMQSHGCCNPYRCTDCKIRKLNLDGFIKHIKRHRHNLKLSCYKCPKVFSRQYDIIMHKKEHNVTEFKCPGCNQTFVNKELLVEHCNTYNKDRKIREVPPEHLTDDLSCVFCQKQFRYKGGLTTHLLTQHREKKRDHTCDKCGKCFLNKANLIGHMLMHDDIRPYECDICKHCFRQRSQLSRHMGVHDGKKPFSCEQCGRCFRLKKQLNTHSIVHTDKFPFICSYCQKGFKHKSTFIQHERQHTGERPYKCHICDREFTNWPNYNKHMKRRHGMNMAKSQQSAESLLTMDSIAEYKMQLATDLTITHLKNFVPKRRGRPKIIKSSCKKKLLHDEINSKVM